MTGLETPTAPSRGRSDMASMADPDSRRAHTCCERCKDSRMGAMLKPSGVSYSLSLSLALSLSLFSVACGACASSCHPPAARRHEGWGSSCFPPHARNVKTWVDDLYSGEDTALGQWTVHLSMCPPA